MGGDAIALAHGNAAAHHPVLSPFTELLAVPAPSGREDQIAGIVRDKLDGRGYAPSVDGAGNVTVALEGRLPQAPLCCLAAHMDEVGLVVTRISPDGSLRVDRSGWLSWKLGESPVEILGDYESLVGVLSMGSLHASSVAERAIGWNEVWILTGLSPEALTAAGVRPGSTAVPLHAIRGPVLFGDPDDPMVGAWSFDNRMGVVALLRLLEALKHQELEPECPTLVAFTVHEEGGGHGAKAIALWEHPEVFVAVDGCPMLPESPLALDGRPGIWSKDRLTHYDQHLIRALRGSAGCRDLTAASGL